MSIPNAVAPKSPTDFVSFQPFPASGSFILTILAVKFIEAYENTRMDGTKEVYPALEFTVGTTTEKGPRFIRLWPMKYSIHEKSNYSKFYKAAKGVLPAAGSNPAELLGLGLQADVSNEDKVSKKGTKYTSSRVKGIAAVHPKLKGEIVGIAELKPALDAAMKPREPGAAKDDSDEHPF